jgi:hypothetical protein
LNNFKIEILGNGGAFDNFSTSYLINDIIMVDCGEAVVLNLIDNSSFFSIVLDDIKHLFITHIHSDHINGLEQLLYYKFIKNNFKYDENFKIYGTKDVLNYYKSLAFSKDPLNNGAYYQPFEFIEISSNGTHSYIIEDANLHVSPIPAKHMNETLNCSSFIFVNLFNNNNKVIITGDIDTINPLISPKLINSETLLFHDMGWTGLPDVQTKYKFHPTEQEVFDFYGENKNILGIHTTKSLKYYNPANLYDVFYI